MQKLIPQKNYTARLDSPSSNSFDLVSVNREIEVAEIVYDQKVNILMVDDHPENLLALEAVLTSPNYNLVGALSGEEALKYVLKDNFAVILMDVQMPGLNGFETAKLIKAREKTKHIPIIFITAISKAEEHVLHGYSVGAVDYIFKPFHPKTLKLKIEEFVSIFRNREQIKEQREMLKNEINERKILTEQLRESNRQIESILESITDAFYSVDRHWCFTYVNREAERQMGRSQEELIGTSLWDVLGQPSSRIYQEFNRAVEQKVPANFESFWDSGMWIEVRAYPSETGLSVCSRDITKRKQTEEDLHLSNERFRKIFESSPCLIAITSIKDSSYIDVNASWLSYTGYTYAEAKNRTATEFFFEKEDGVRLAPYNLESAGPVRNAKISYVTKSGEVRKGFLSTEIIKIREEKCLLMVVTDVTERVQLEKEMNRLASLNLIGEMAAGIAHEIRNPMTSVRGFLQMSKGNGNILSSECIDLLVCELDRANAIITEFLTLAKNKKTAKNLQHLNSIVEALFPLIQAEALLTDKRVELELGECPELYLDEKEIRQVILNIALNGLEAMSSGGGLTIKTYVVNNAVVLEIRDQGCGITEEFLEHIGTPFFTTKEGGTGLGLAVCYSIANRHHAVIDVETSKQGTAFLIRFRLNEDINTALPCGY